MAYVITEPCIGTKGTGCDCECLDVCPSDCIHPSSDEEDFDSADMLHIDPEDCIDCGACADECPVDAILPDDDVPEDMQAYIAKNAEYFQ